MAIFASTTTSGYSDPMKAMTLKALEQRQKDLLAQQAQQQMPDSIPTPIQGISHVVNQLGDSMRAGRADAALAARREDLARVMANIGPEGPTPQQLAQIHSADPELGSKYAQQAFDARQKAADRSQEKEVLGQRQTFESGQNELNRGETRATREQQGQLSREQMDVTRSEGAATRTNQRDLATQSQRANADLAQAERDVKVAEAALDRAAKSDDREAQIKAQRELEDVKARHGMARDAANNAATAALPQSDRGKIEGDIQKGAIPADQADAARRPEVKPAQIKGAAEAKEQYTQHKLSIEKLDQAQQALSKGIYTGPWQSAQTLASQATGGRLGDKEKAQRTTDFNNIINEIATGAMSKTLKGQSTDFEMKQFQKIYNDPNSSDAARAQALDRLVRAARADLTTHGEAVRSFGGDTTRIDEDLKRGGGASAAPSGDEMVRRGREAGVIPPAAGGGGGGDRVVDVKSEAEAMALPVGTRFNLNGRQGKVQ